MDFSSIGGQEVKTSSSPFDFSSIGGSPVQQEETAAEKPTSLADSAVGMMNAAVPYIQKGLKFADNPGYAIRGEEPPQVNTLDPITPIGNLFDKAGQYAADKLGQKFPNHPYLDASAAMVGSTLANPLTTAGPKAGISFKEGLSPEVAAQREARTGVPAYQFQRLNRDPAALWASGDIKKAGAEIGSAKSAAGINLGISDDPASLTPENLERINPTKAIKMDDIHVATAKIAQGQPLLPQEAQNALDSVNSIMSQPSVAGDPNVMRQWSLIKNKINDALGQVAPDVYSANQNYARLKLRDQFAGNDPLNKSGTISKLGKMAQGAAGLVGGALGHFIPYVNSVEGSILGYKAAEKLNHLYHSPHVAGLQTALGSYLDKVGNPILGGASNAAALTAPQAAYLANYQNANLPPNGQRSQ